MAYRDFQEFLTRLETEGELKRIQYPLDPHLEITEVADRMMKTDGPALLIEKPKGFDIPVAINTMGSRKRMSMALGVDDFESIADEITELIKPEIPKGIIEKLRMVPKLRRLASLPPKTVKEGRCQEVVFEGKDVDLNRYPLLHCWPMDGGRYITLPLVFTHDPLTGKRNVGMYRIQQFDKCTAGMHWQMHKEGAEHYRLAEEKNRRIEVAVALGGDPAVIFSSIAPLPSGIDEMLFAGFLRHSPVEMVKCRTLNIEVPADSEIVIEGYVDPLERRTEGPFGDHTGYYSLADEYPVLHITAITQRKKPVYPATIVGIPPMEDGWMGKAIERIFLPLIRLTLPEIVDMNLPIEGAFHNVALVSIKKRYPGHAFKIMNALWGLGQMMFTKYIFVFDADVNVQDISECIWRMGANTDPARDALIVKGPYDVLDHASDVMGFGGKLGLDCTHKLPSEGFPREWPPEIRMSSEVKNHIDSIWKELGI
jgi:4-hydroxy-3-polyprenylbenzoate decarboxylase